MCPCGQATNGRALPLTKRTGAPKERTGGKGVSSLGKIPNLAL
jgi:hypothetical protein